MTMTEDRTGQLDIIIARVSKLWRKANDPAATEAEREAFETKALMLMEEHRLTEAMLDLGYTDTMEDRQLIKLSGRNARIQIDLIDNVVRAYDSRLYWQGYGLNYTVMVFGFKSDFDRIQALSTMLLADALAGAGKLTGYNAANTLALRRGYVEGYGWAIGRRLREAKRLAHEAERRTIALHEIFGEGADDPDIDWSAYEDEIAAVAETVTSGSALVLADKAKRVQDEFSTRSMRHAASTRSGAASGQAAGRAAGERASLSSSNRIGSRGALGR